MIKRFFPEDYSTAIKIVEGESNFNPTVCGKNKNNTYDCGLWQINDIHSKTLESMGLDRKNPIDATIFARYLYDKNGGWSDWVFYNNYLSHH